MAGPYNIGHEVNYLGIGKQSVLGTGVVPTVFVPYTGDVNVEHGMEGDDVFEGGTGPYMARAVKTKHKPGAGFALPWRPSTAGRLAAWFLGADSVGGAGPYDHTSTPAEPVTFISLETNQSDEIIERFVDAALAKMTITSPEANGELMAAFDWLGGPPAWQAAATAETYESGIHGSTPGAPFRASDGTFTIENVTATNVVSWEASLDWNIDGDIFTSKVTRNRLLKLRLTVDLTVRTLELDGNDYRATNYGTSAATAASGNYRNATNIGFRAVYDNGLAAANQRTVTVTVPEIQWVGAPRKLNAQGGTSYLERKAKARKGAGALVTVLSKTGDVAAY
jgi:hypothetical protein